MTAIDLGVVVPIDTPRRVWQAIRMLDDLPLARFKCIALVADEALVREILGVLTDPNAGDQLRDFAVFAFLREPSAARHIRDDDLLAILERVRSNTDATHLAKVVSARHQARALNRDLLLAIRGQLMRSDDPRIRQVAVDVDEEIADADLAFLERVLGDEDAGVRAAAAYAYAWDKKPLATRQTLDLIERAVANERCSEPLVALLEAKRQLITTLGVETASKQ